MKKSLLFRNTVLLITIFFFTIIQSASAQNWQLIHPVYPTTDDVVAGYSVADYGATGDGVTDVTAIFQGRLNALGAAGGGTLWVPAGKYRINGNLLIPKGVTLRGDWQQPVPGQPITGTILMAYAGRGDTSATPFITEQTACAVMNLAIWYPLQDPNNIVPYPNAIQMGANGFWGNDFNNAKNITLVNAYEGVELSLTNGGGCPVIMGIYGTPLSTGIMVDNIADVGRLENIDFSAAYWEGSGLPGSPSAGSAMESFIYQHGTGILMRRDDWTYTSFVSVTGYGIGFRAAPSIASPGAIPNGHNYGMTFTNCNTGIYFDGVSNVGIMFAKVTIVNCVNGVVVGPGASVTNGAVQMHTCTIDATNAILTDGTSAARFMMERCTISRGKVDIGGGTFMASDCDFNNTAPQIIMEKNSRSIITGNRFQSTRKIQNNSLWLSAIDSTTTFTLKQLPNFPTIVPETHQAARQVMYLATAAPYNAKNDGTTDNTTAIQNALNQAAADGGGIVFLPPGHYKVSGDLSIASGVELKGSADLSSAPYGPGSVLEVYADQGNANGTPFLRLAANSGVRGIVFDYPNQVGSLVPNFPVYPYTIQGNGSNIYIINIGFRSVYNGVDLFTNRCDNHYLDYVCGQVFQNVFTVGGGSTGGKIYNAHFNTIYYANGTESKFGSWPNSPSTDGDPAVYNYNYNNCKFLNLGNCQNETLYNDFIYGSQQGINLNSDAGFAPTGISLGLGIDGTRNSMNFNAIGAAGFDFINTQTVALGDAGNRYITTTPTFASQNSTLFNSDYWGNPPNGIILNGGTVNLQQANFNQPGQTNFGQLTSGLLNIFGSAIWPVNTELNAGAEHLLNAQSSIIDSSNIIRPNVALWKNNLGNAWAVNPLKAMPRTGWSATGSVDNGEAQNALDSNETTRWATTGAQTPGQSYTVDMKNLKQFYQIALENASSSGDYPVGYAVYVSTDGTNWGSPIATGAGTSGLTIITFPTQVARYIKVVQTGTTSFGWWSIFEFYVFGVDYHAATSVTVSPGTATINIGATQKLTATILPANASDTAVTWVSSDPTKATVDSTGLVTGIAAGTATITVTTHDGGKTATSTITVGGTSSPYGGTPWPIPGTIQSEDYDLGGQGIAYNDSDPTNDGGQYRPTEGVDIEASAEGGYDVGYTNAGEWLKYTVNVTAPGVYTMESRIAANSATGAFHVMMDGTNISGSVAVPNTGGFQYWQTINTTTTYLTVGQHVMTVFIDAAGFNLNYISFVGPITAGLAVNIAAPLNNVVYTGPATLPLTANASTSTGTITKVEFYSNGTKIGESDVAPYTFNWIGVAVGTYNITAKVTNSSGSTTISDAVVVTVNAAIPTCPLLTWSDEFNGTTLDVSKWNYQTGNGCPGICGWGNNELEYYTSNTNNISVGGGALALTAQYQPNYIGSGNNYTSGKIVTSGKFSQKYGHFEARIKVPSAAGTWPAFWMLADSTAWPGTGEIDIEECANKNPVTWFGTLHFANSGGSHLSQGYQWNDPTPLSNDYHVYAADWTTDSISFYIDNVLRGTVTKTALIAAGGVWPFDSQKFYIIMNLAVGGQFTGQTPNPTDFPQSMLVDYVRVYSKAPCSGTVPVISSAATASGTQGTAITNYTITASNTPTSFAVTNLPSGLSLNTSTGVISGTPTVSGTFVDTIKAINASGTGTQVLTFTITPGTVENDLTQKLMMGYQGWFLAQGDNSQPNDWRHWFHSTTDPSAGQLNFDLFPDLTEYKTMYPTSMVYPGGAPVKLYSSHDSSTVNTHFRWMQQYNIYGVYLQRFLGEVVNDPRFFAVRNDVTKNVANASQIYGRHYAIMYDISGVPDDGTLYTKLVKDWQYLVDSQNINTQSVYIKQKGLPVVAIWGIGFAGRGLKVSTFDSLINYFHYLAPAKYRAYVVGGVPGQWRTLNGDSETDTSWTHVYHSLDMISPWAVGRYTDNAGADNWKTQRIVPDLADCNTNNVNYMPVIFPGFSWMNENGGTLNQIPRNGGNFYWHQAYNAKTAGSNFIYVAMFDEVDEGTAMLKAAPTHATVPTTGTYLTLDADGYNCLPSDWYLQLANETQKMLDGTTAASSTIPLNPNRCDTVSVTSSGSITEGGAAGTFIIKGTNVTSNITVNYTISGTASTADYSASPALSGSVTLTSAVPSVTINVNALTDGITEPTETLILTLSTATLYTASTIPATISILDAGAPTGCSTSMIVNATSVPTIDGTVDAVWNNAPKNTIAQTISGTIQTGSTWQAMYDATNLYVLVQVKDANLSSVGTNVYDQDGVELFLSGNNSKAGTYNATYDHQYRFNWNVTPSVANISGNTNSKTGITYAIPTSAGGYTLEAAIPWTTIGGAAPYNGEPIGFDVNLNDQQNNAGAREATAGWYLTNNDDYQNTAGFGTVNLTVCAATTPVITSAATANGTVNAAFTYNVTATSTPTSYSVGGVLPAGVTINTATGVISGTPTVTGTFVDTVKATNAGGTGTQVVTITINPAIPVVNSGSTTGTVGTAFSYTISATNNPTSYSSTILPAGLILNATTGVISGTPTIAGTFTITDTAKNISGAGNGTLTIVINPAKPIVANTSTTGTVGAAFSYTISATNNPTSYTSTTLPAGLTLNTSTGIISGTPTTAGTFTVTDTAKNISGAGNGTLTIVINPAKPVVANASTTGTVGAAFSYPISATNSPTSYSSTILPAGLTLNISTGIISGTPTTAGTFTITDTAKNISGAGNGTLTIVINLAKPVVANASTIGTVGTAFSYTISATNNPTSYSSTILPAGLILNATTGVISGTPTTAGTFTVTDTAKNISGAGNGTLTIVINPARPVISSASVNGTTGVAFSYTIAATNNPTSYGASALPAGLGFNPTTGTISGTPTTAGTFIINDTATNISGSGTGTLTITITTILPPAPVVTSGSITGTVGIAFNYSIIATNSPTGYSSTTLPAGLSLNSAGIISGIPTTAGTFVITDTAKNAGGAGTGTLTIVINPAKPVVANASTTGTVGTVFSYTISATNSPTSYSSTTLPAGLSLNTSTGIISGTPTTAGTFTVTDTAKNISGAGNGTLTIVINPAKPVVANTSTTGTVGTAFSYTISATNNPTSYSSTALPAGLSLNTSTGIISGTPTTAGTFTIIDTAKNISGAGNGTLTIVINPAKPVVANTSTTGTVGTAFSYTISATNNPTSYSSTVLPTGLSLNTSTGLISGTPTTAGTFTIADTAKNISGAGNGTLTIVINPAKPLVANASTTGTVGTVFSYTISATNNPTSYNSTTLPAGLTLNTALGVITGTPTIAGTFTVTDTAKNISGAGNGTLTIVINPAKPVISSASVNGTTGVAFNYTIAATNNPTSYGASALPAGLGFNPTTGTISGTPTTAGTFIINDTATNISGSGTGTLTITITTILPSAPVVSSGSIAGTVGVAFNYSIIATNSPTGYSSTTLPAGLSLNSAGIISGIPTTAGTFVITDTAKNAGGNGTGTITITINPAKPVVTAASTTGTVGIIFSYTIIATNNPTSYSSTILPAGLILNTSTGVISGTPTTAGTFTITDTAKNISGAGTGTLTIVINPAKPVVANASTTGTVGTAFSYTINATNNPTSYSSTTLPAGLSLNTSTGIISGTPTTAGTFTITDTAKNISGAGNGTLTITINPPLPTVPVVSSAASATGTVGVAFNYTITASNNPISYAATNNLPAGLTINPATGVISGTPTVAGTFVDTIKATNAAGTGTKVLTITIVLNPPVITSSTVAGGNIGTAFNYAITATNNPTSYTSTTLPAGLTINTSTGVISGTPTVSGTFTVTLTATNAAGSGTQLVTIIINALPGIPVIGGNGAVSGIVNVPFEYDIVATNAVSYNASGLPTGLSINTTTGKITGTPVASGSYTVTISATNTNGTQNNILEITITAAPLPIITSDTAITVAEGDQLNYAIEADNAPTSYAATGLPAGVTINTTTGIISGVPTVSGVFKTTITATNSAGSTSEEMDITVIGSSPVLMPNPVTQGYFILTLPHWTDGETVNVIIRNFIGKEVQSGTAVINNGSIHVNVPNLIAGNYVAVVIGDSNKKVAKKFTVK